MFAASQWGISFEKETIIFRPLQKMRVRSKSKGEYAGSEMYLDQFRLGIPEVELDLIYGRLDLEWIASEVLNSR